MLNTPIRRTLTVAVLACTLLAGCDSSETANANMGAPMPTEVDVVTLNSQPVSLTTELSGRTSAYRIAEVRPQVSGIIRERLFSEGSDVKAGQVLYRIDPASYKAEVAIADAALAKARAAESSARLKAQRYAELVKVNAISTQDHDDAQASLKQQQAEIASAQAQLDAARINLAYTEIKAPIDGRIGKSAITEGALVTAEQSTALASIQQLNPLYVDMRQSTTELLRLKRSLADGSLVTVADNKAEITLLLEDGSAYEQKGLLQFADVSVDESTGMVNLRAEVPNPNQFLLPGMFVRGEVTEGERPKGLLVPQVAVTRTPNGRATVMTVDAENTVALRDISISRAIDDQWLVESGLEDGVRVITAGIQKVRPGMTVRISAQNTPQEMPQNNAPATPAADQH
ncbi:efflux RND transporter periplasmic adaptor subunit [Marinobacterium rhizophilum]|uniref:efflux RND transporter periplasmic adaptor subunit n=1 Tax=Marinobacterium rhizophilum TaxID=420402 RepID=UPI000375D8DB|nr:efflux RND transporter periplasmic adaptor subunit [Marinobacterium rhizophilum]